MTLRPLRPFGLYPFIPLWLAACVYFTYATLDPSTQWQGGVRPPLEAMLPFWGVGVWLVYLGLWSIYGAEIIKADAGGLAVERRLFGVTLSSHEYPQSQIGHLRYDLVSDWEVGWKYTWSWPSRRYGFGVGPIVFDFAGREVRVADGLRNKESEAKELLASLSGALRFTSPAPE